QFLGVGPCRGDADVNAESVENATPRLRTGRVLLPLPLADAYDYSVPEGLSVAPRQFGIVPLGKRETPGVRTGQFVVGPLGKRETLGVVWGEGTGEVAAAKLRDVTDVLPALPMA